MAERSNASDCKSGSERVRWFESGFTHKEEVRRGMIIIIGWVWIWEEMWKERKWIIRRIKEGLEVEEIYMIGIKKVIEELGAIIEIGSMISIIPIIWINIIIYMIRGLRRREIGKWIRIGSISIGIIIIGIGITEEGIGPMITRIGYGEEMEIMEQYIQQIIKIMIGIIIGLHIMWYMRVGRRIWYIVGMGIGIWSIGIIEIWIWKQRR